MAFPPPARGPASAPCSGFLAPPPQGRPRPRQPSPHPSRTPCGGWVVRGRWKESPPFRITPNGPARMHAPGGRAGTGRPLRERHVGAPSTRWVTTRGGVTEYLDLSDPRWRVGGGASRRSGASRALHCNPELRRGPVATGIRPVSTPRRPPPPGTTPPATSPPGAAPTPTTRSSWSGGLENLGGQPTTAALPGA